jgi:lipid-A-disaccharide synthase
MPLKFALVAGEHSGDQLGAGLIRELRRRHPDARFFGVAGPQMVAEGCTAWHPAERLAVMGFFEVLAHLPGLFALRADLLKRFGAERPDVFVGIDSPEFNLGLARRLHDRGIPTVQYVSPQVWAWRRDRVHTIGKAVDLVLCLLPFEQELYASAGVRTAFVGHPRADQIPLTPDQAAARRALGMGEGSVVALLPGSRRGEVKRLGEDFAAAVQWVHERRPEVQFIAPMANPTVRAMFAAALSRVAPSVTVKLLEGQAQTALAAADAVLVASGTATLEAALSKRPMVVAYRINPLTAWVVRLFDVMKAPFFSHPNLLAGRRLVPELAQEQVTAQALGAALLEEIENEPLREEVMGAFTRMHHELRRDASARAAEAVLTLLPSANPAGAGCAGAGG